MYIDMYIDVYIDMYIDVYIDMCIHLVTQVYKSRHIGTQIVNKVTSRIYL